MPNVQNVEGQLCELYSKPEYGSLFERMNRFGRGPQRVTPQSLSKEAARSLLSSQALLDPVQVEELRGGVVFYRAFDGISSEQGTAMTLGRSWSSSALVERLWKATGKLSGATREQAFMDFMRSANFIHPAWNQMLHIACMRVPSGVPVVVIRGRGNWEAMRTNRPGTRKSPYPKPFHPFQNPPVESVDDVLYSLHMMPTPGEEQYNIPLFNDMWVRKVEKNPGWPLA
jgi:hypothetical protein